MSASILLALMLHGGLAGQHAAVGGMMWEETALKQSTPDFHPFLRFNTQSTMIRFSPSSNYMLTTMGLVQQGQFQVQDGHYTFRCVSANELEKADISKLAADMSPHDAKSLVGKYIASTYDFEGNYDDSNGALTIAYPIGGKLQSYQLHLTTEGDDQLPLMVPEASAGMVGLWYAPEPYPDKLDARTRAKIDLDGLPRFAKEAEASNAAQFGILDLRRNGSFRIHSILGPWQKLGSTLRLKVKTQNVDFAISPDGTKLLLGGQVAYVRN
jgi:hypothetical protein